MAATLTDRWCTVPCPCTRPFGSLIVMSCPMSVSFWPSGVYCYVVVSCLWHLVHLLPYLKCHSPCRQYFTLFISCLLLCCCSMSVIHLLSCNVMPQVCFTLSNMFTVMLLSHECATGSICCLTCNTMRHVHFTLPNICLLLLSHVCGTWSICCLTCIPCPMSVSLCPIYVYCYVAFPWMWHSFHLECHR